MESPTFGEYPWVLARFNEQVGAATVWLAPEVVEMVKLPSALTLEMVP